MIEIVTENQIVSIYRGFGREGEGEGVLVFVFVMRGEGEIGTCCGGGEGETAI